MKSLLAVLCLLSFCNQPLLAQMGGRGGSLRRKVVVPDQTPNTTTVLSGKVVVSDGSVLTAPATIQSICRGQKRTETHTDSRGNFSFEFGGRMSASSDASFDADAPSGNLGTGTDRRNVQDCELQASLAGFASDSIQLSGKISGSENVDIGRIVLHRLSNVEGLTMSATTAMAPEPARRAWQKGQEQAKKGKWDEAQGLFQQAVQLYPKFAAAWFELGNAQLHKQDPVGARRSFEQSISADSRFINPYQGLTQLAMREQKWQEVTEFSEKLLALNPISFPEAWFANGAGHYYLKNLAAAEKSARRGLEVDGDHRVPRLEYLLGMVLVGKPDYADAARHLQMFLRLSTKPADVAEAKKQLDEVARLSAAASLNAQQK